MAKTKVNARWFKDRLADKKLSARGFAKMIDTQPSHISRSINGKRTWKHDELVAFATLVGASFEETMLAAGLTLPTGEGKGMVTIAGTIDSSGHYSASKVAAPRRAPAPPDAPAGIVAARFETPSTPAESLDGWLVYFADGVKRVPPEAVGRLGIAWLGGDGAVLGILRRGYVRGTFNVTPWVPGSGSLENIQVERCSPVLWIRCSSS